MYARVVVYSYSEDRDELEARARAGVIPIVTGSKGYISYGVMFQDQHVVSISQWESEEHAKAADAALGEWVKANTTMQSETLRRPVLAGARGAVGRLYLANRLRCPAGIGADCLSEPRHAQHSVIPR
jgi:heme-degrading monooxygenase HmoA